MSQSANSPYSMVGWNNGLLGQRVMVRKSMGKTPGMPVMPVRRSLTLTPASGSPSTAACSYDDGC